MFYIIILKYKQIYTKYVYTKTYLRTYRLEWNKK